MKLTSRLIAIVVVALAGYFAISWYVPRQAAKRDLAGIEERLDAMEQSLAILVDRVQGTRDGGGGARDVAALPAAYDREADARVDRILEALEATTRALQAQAAAVDELRDK